jgi:hypothetical protein
MVAWSIPEGLRNLVATVAYVSEGGLSMGSTDQVSQPSLQIVISIPVVGVKPGQEATMHDFMRVVDPRGEALIAGMTQ